MVSAPLTATAAGRPAPRDGGDDDALPFDQRPEAAVLSAPAAPVPADWAADLAQRHWGRTGHTEPLAGERDANFRLTEPAAAPGAAPARWLLKVSHPIEAPEVTDFQTQALLHLERHAPALPVQRLAATRDGAHAVTATAPDGRPRVLRLISWLDGLPMPQAPKSAAQRDSVATLLARIDRALATLDPALRHPAAHRPLPWDISRAHQVRGLLEPLPDPARRRLALAALDQFEHGARHRLAALPRQPIHNDFNVHNLLVDPAAPERVSAVLDFGDMVAAPRVNDLAVAAAYQLDAEGDALGTVAAFAAAYHRAWPLRADELDLLWPLVQARLAMVVAISGWRAQREPDKADYLLRNNPVSWARLAACAPVAPEQARAALRAACGL